MSDQTRHPEDAERNEESPDEQLHPQNQDVKQERDTGEAQTDPLEALTQERDELMGRLQRVSADYANYQKRVKRDLEAERAYANEQLIKSLLGVLDDMERAMEAARANHDEDDPLLKGMQLVHDNLLGVLGKFGVRRFEAEGESFDPERHSALLQEETGEVPPMTVLKVIQRGYELKGRTIRPAQVVVSKAPEEQDEQE